MANAGDTCGSLANVPRLAKATESPGKCLWLPCHGPLSWYPGEPADFDIGQCFLSLVFPQDLSKSPKTMKKLLPKRKPERKPSDEEFALRKSECLRWVGAWRAWWRSGWPSHDCRQQGLHLRAGPAEGRKHGVGGWGRLCCRWASSALVHLAHEAWHAGIPEAFSPPSRAVACSLHISGSQSLLSLPGGLRCELL